jgi:hypothetical protein
MLPFRVERCVAVRKEKKRKEKKRKEKKRNEL